MTGEHPQLNTILSINTSDAGGGAEQIAWDLFTRYRESGINSWLAVGNKKRNDQRVITYHENSNLDYSSYCQRSSRFKRRWLQSAQYQIGIEDFEYPLSYQSQNLAGEQPDIIHCHNLHGGYFDLRALIPISQSVPVVITLHDLWLTTGHCAHPLSCTQWKTGCGNCPDLTLPPAIHRDATKFNWWRKANILKQCKLYIATPSAWLMDRVHQSIPKAAIVESRVIPNGIDLESFHPTSKTDARSKLPDFLPRTGHMAVFVAHQTRSNPFKDFSTIRSAIKHLGNHKLASPVHLVAIGESGDTEHFGDSTIHYIDSLNHENLVKYYQAADICLHSTKGEVFGMTIAEAMACGTPVIATDIGSIPEIIGSNANGILVNANDPQSMSAAIRQLLDDDARRITMGESAARFSQQHYCHERMTLDYLSWFHTILRKSEG